MATKLQSSAQESVHALATKALKKLTPLQKSRLLLSMISTVFDESFDSDEARIDDMQECLTCTLRIDVDL